MPILGILGINGYVCTGAVWQYESRCSAESEGPLENSLDQGQTDIGMDVAEVDIIQKAFSIHQLT